MDGMTGMIQPERYTQEEIRKIQRACCHIFRSEKALHSVVVAESDGKVLHYPFLERLTYDDVKQAYRSNVFTLHPDRHHDKAPEEIEYYTRQVEHLNRSYDYLSTVFSQGNAHVTPDSVAKMRIIAVGGAKGGIGKSMFAANLGTMLSALGFRVMMFDLDLGGSDLHIYMGHRQMPETTLNDFLNRKITSLTDAVVGCDRGPMLIGGNAAELGSANIAFQKKVRLIEAIRKMNADYVVLDLGGSTDFNTLDFFLAADLGIVLTTLDQAAYLEAYAFIKTALQRKLNRLFAADSTFPARKNSKLKQIVAECTTPPEGARLRTVQDLLEEVAKEDPLALPLLADEILTFSPRLVINRCFDSRAALRVASTLRTVACQRLSVDIDHVGTIARHSRIEQSTTYLHHPLVARQPSGLFASEMRSIIDALDLSN
jgi:flagellar biosynthesis protein FlhG